MSVIRDSRFVVDKDEFKWVEKLTLVLLYTFSRKFQPKKTPLKLIKYSVVDAQVIKYFNLGDVHFS